MKALVIALSLLLLAGPLAAKPLASHKPQAPATPKCLGSAAGALEHFKSMMSLSDHFELKEWAGQRAEALLKAFNEQEPPTAFRGNRIMLLLNSEDKERLVFLLAQDDCITQMGWSRVQLWSDLVTKTLGDPT